MWGKLPAVSAAGKGKWRIMIMDERRLCVRGNKPVGAMREEAAKARLGWADLVGMRRFDAGSDRG